MVCYEVHLLGTTTRTGSSAAVSTTRQAQHWVRKSVDSGAVEKCGSRHCLIRCFAVNAYVEPVVSRGLDIIAAAKDIGDICRAAEERGLRVEQFEQSVNITSDSSNLRIQLQADPTVPKICLNCRDARLSANAKDQQ